MPLGPLAHDSRKARYMRLLQGAQAAFEFGSVRLAADSRESSWCLHLSCFRSDDGADFLPQCQGHQTSRDDRKRYECRKTGGVPISEPEINPQARRESLGTELRGRFMG